MGKNTRSCVQLAHCNVPPFLISVVTVDQNLANNAEKWLWPAKYSLFVLGYRDWLPRGPLRFSFLLRSICCQSQDDHMLVFRETIPAIQLQIGFPKCNTHIWGDPNTAISIEANK